MDTIPLEECSARGGAAAARWAHNPKVGGSNPPPATKIATTETAPLYEGLLSIRAML
jgi:hypothetical protein